jgi:hypothetical protein
MVSTAMRTKMLGALISLSLIGVFHAAHAQGSSPVGCGAQLRCLDQGWTDEDRSWWYTVSQGSRLLPLDWLQALEQPGLQERFFSDANMARFNYLPNPQSEDNPRGLPVGFAIDQETGARADIMCDTFPAACENGTMRKPWVGMNCSACHTGQITYKERTIRIDGAPALADFQNFTKELLLSLKETRDDPGKFDRFARAVLGDTLSVERRIGLGAELAEQITWLERVESKNGTPLPYGYGRLDAQGHILNKISLVVSVPEQLAGFGSDAPASYPHIWNAPQHRKLQWNGIASNLPRSLRLELIAGKETDLGALVRNTGEVLGVFAHIDIDEKSRTTYRSSLRLSNMIDLERRLGRLESPRWPEHLLEPINWDLAVRGKPLFEAHCQSCHQPLDPRELRLPANEAMLDLQKSGTDLALACNAFLHRSEAGVMEGRRQFIFVGERLAKQDFTRSMLTNAIVGAILGRSDELVRKPFEDVFFRARDALFPAIVEDDREYLPGVKDPVKKARAEACLKAQADILAYKSRPLNGIWATAPYLHNGSVPSLYDLLLPARVRNVIPKADLAAYLESLSRPPTTGTRPESFAVGSREFDPVNVGIKIDTAGSRFQFKVLDDTGAPLPGNFNSGHDYATTLREDQRRALVEYLKTL